MNECLINVLFIYPRSFVCDCLCLPEMIKNQTKKQKKNKTIEHLLSVFALKKTIHVCSLEQCSLNVLYNIYVFWCNISDPCTLQWSSVPPASSILQLTSHDLLFQRLKKKTILETFYTSVYLSHFHSMMLTDAVSMSLGVRYQTRERSLSTPLAGCE